MASTRKPYSAQRDTNVFDYHQTSTDLENRQKDFNVFQVVEVQPCQTFFDQVDITEQQTTNSITAKLTSFFKQQISNNKPEISAMCSIGDTIVLALNWAQVIMFDTLRSEIIYTNRNLTKTYIKHLKICRCNGKYYMISHTADSALQLFSFPNPQFMDSLDQVKSFYIYEDGKVRTLYPNGVVNLFRIKEGGQFELCQPSVTLPQCEEILGCCLDKTIIKQGGKLWLLSVDQNGGIARLPLKPYTFTLVDNFQQRFICTLANQTYIVDVWGRERPFITWQNVVKDIILCQPYLVAVCSSHIEIRHLFTSMIQQKVELVQTRMVQPWTVAFDAAKLYLILESRDSQDQVLLSLIQAPTKEQVNKLRDSKMWNALELYSELMAESGEVNLTDLDEVRRHKFLYQFNQGEYRKALDCHVQLELILLIFSELLPKEQTSLLQSTFKIDDLGEYLKQEAPVPLHVFDSRNNRSLLPSKQLTTQRLKAVSSFLQFVDQQYKRIDLLADQSTKQIVLKNTAHFWILHATILIERSKGAEGSQHSSLFEILKDNQLPVIQTKELLFRYLMYDECLVFLFYKGLFDEILKMAKGEFLKLNEELKTKSDENQQFLKEFWLSKYINFSQKLNCKSVVADSKKAEKQAIVNSEWLFKIDLKAAVKCLQADDAPFTSGSIFQFLKQKGGVRGCICYLQYITSKIEQKIYHNELGCLLLQDLMRRKAEESEKHRLKFLEFLKTKTYDAQVMLNVISGSQPEQQKLVQRENAWLSAKNGQRHSAFEFLIKNDDLKFALDLAESIEGYSELYIALIRQEQQEEAKQLLVNHPERMDLSLIIDYIPLTENIQDLYSFLQQGLVRKESQQKEALLKEALTYQKYEQILNLEYLPERNKHILITSETVCCLCAAPIGKYPFRFDPVTQQVTHLHEL